MDGTAARRSIVYDSGRVSHLGEYEVRKIAMPSAIGIASTSANSEANTVTWKRSRTPNAIALMFCVTHSRLVRKLTWFRLKAGTARQIRNAPIAAMTTVMKIAEPDASKLKMRSPGRSEEHTSELQSLMRISYAVLCLKQNKKKHTH